MFNFFQPRIPDKAGLHERKLHAWMLLMGERFYHTSKADKAVRSHRGGLPDFDPSMVVPDPHYRPWLRRLIVYAQRLAGSVESLEIAPAALLSPAVLEPIGKPAPASYTDDVEALPVDKLEAEPSASQRAAA
ncbi:hypothetical protein GA830_00055 [Mesorhizobium sp. NBSH29]|uniref:hypothetical protein n=1 Tax=Mesorhizobium sp. NBSH29 TaxID=2654249 RepID=UPI0018969D8A|nr:hypothetical protein [Mesorhizobium sp. NBSH29]QPC85306.1 hypothetical protein GA830_00055 [Mesorhizobium sp. NBSH29]